MSAPIVENPPRPPALPRALPPWAEDLRRRYLRGEASMFLLHGNEAWRL